MADFTGMTVKVTMRDGLVVEGKVSEVVAGQTLTLQQGKELLLKCQLTMCSRDC